MKLHLLIALIGCAISSPLHAKDSGTWLRNGWHPYAGHVDSGGADAYEEEREHWLRSRLKFSGKTNLNSDGRDGALGLAADKLIGQADAIGFNYRDSRSYKDSTDSNAASVRYQFPAGANRVQVEAARSRYDHAVSHGAHRYDSRGESRVLGFAASRPLFSRFGMNIGGIARHRGRDHVAFEKDELVSESRYQLSSLGLEASGGHELAGGLFAKTRILALSGREFSATDYPMQRNTSDTGEFYKVAMSASVEQQWFQWTWRVNGRYQFADEDLPVSEYLTVAGPSMLAGFNGQSVAVVRGGWLRLGTNSPLWQTPFMDDVLSSLNLAVLQGWVPYSGAQANRHGKASAGEVSLNLQGRAFTANVSVGQMIHASTTAMAMPDHPDVRFTLTMGI